MDSWNCCRACLGVESLHPIFQQTELHEKYSEIIFYVTGLKVEFTDTLPKQMCTECINFVNKSYKFRKKCEENHLTLLNRLNEREISKVKLESHVYGADNVTIDISDLIKDLETYNDSKDNIDNFNDDSIESNCDGVVEFETQVQDIVDKPVEIIFKNKNKGCKSEKIVRRSMKKKTEDGEKKVRAKQVGEKVECDYCHKILSSKLSLRNHFKIHTGFDVVCEHCGKKFITRRLLLMHCRAKHGYEKTDKCSFCDYRASNAEQVKIHERLHTGEKPFVCSVCGAGFHRNSSYLQHVAIHLPDKNVQCDQCPARFKSVTLMKIHKNKHKGRQYSFKCTLCENNFARRRNVARHLLRIHSVINVDHHINRLKIAN